MRLLPMLVWTIAFSALAHPRLLMAQGPPDSGRQAELIEKYDRDGDKKLSEEEMKAALPPEETGARPEEPREPSVMRQDADATDDIIRNDRELQALQDEFDRDGNGKLDNSEMAALRDALHARLETGQADSME